MKDFFRTMIESVYHPGFYRELLDKPLAGSLRYFFALALLIAVTVTLISALPLATGINRFLLEAPEQFFEYYPDGVEITVSGGQVTVNQPEPYYFPIPQQFRDEFAKQGVEYVLAIDTSTPATPDAMNFHRTLTLISKDHVAYRNDNGGMSIQPIDPDVSFTISEPWLRTLEDVMSSYYRYVAPAVVMAIFLLLLTTFTLGHLAYLCVLALPMWGIMRALGMHVSYGKAYQIGLHAVTIMVLAQLFFAVFMVSVPFLPTAATLVLVTLNYWMSARATTTPSPQS
jgi:hypothetical protein